jgi:hypothetical protein
VETYSGARTPLLIGCVAEPTPKFLDQALNLLRSLRWFGGSASDAAFIVCVVGEIDAAQREKFEELNARVRSVERFSELHPQSNKLRFLETEEAGEADRVILLDCDTIVVRDLSAFLAKTHFQAKIADVRTISPETFERLFAAFELAIPPEDYFTTVDCQPTIPYFNAGVLAFSNFAMRTMVPMWVDLTRQLIAQFELLGGEIDFCEQASLSMALVAAQLDFVPLGNEMNFPMHLALPAGSLMHQTDPAIIHYHSLTDERGFVLASPYPAVNQRIAGFNARLKQALQATDT